MSKDTATSDGVVDNDEADDAQEETALSPRDQAMADLAAKRFQEADEEAGVAVGAPDEDQVGAQLEDEEEDDEEEEEEEEEQLLLDEDTIKKAQIKVKVDGEESVLSLDELRRSVQKEAAATRRLEEASRIYKEAKEYEEQIKRANQTRSTDTDEVAPSNDGSEAGDAQAALRSGIRSALDALMESDEETATEQLYEVVTQAVKQLTKPGDTVQPDEIARQIRQQLDQESALEQFSSAYPEIMADPYLADIADSFLGGELQSGNHTSMRDAFISAGEKTREWMRAKGFQVAAQEQSPTTDLSERVRRKAEANIPASASARAVVDSPEISSPSSVIAEMRQARPGQA